jgi:hypothetical protein
MSQPLVGRSNGRLSRALRAIRTLMALGITEAEDMVSLIRVYRDRLCRRPRTHRDAGGHAGRLGRLARAQRAVRWMMALGFSETEIAALADVAPSTIAHLLDPRVSRAVSRPTVRRLVQAMHATGAERLNVLLGQVAITVLDIFYRFSRDG